MKIKTFGMAIGTAMTLTWLGCGGAEESQPSADAGTTTTDDAGNGGGPTDTPGDDAGTKPGTDAGKDVPPAEDAGPLEFDAGIDAPIVDIQYGSCTTFTPCASDPTGTWEFTSGGCVDALSIDICKEMKISDLKVQGTLTHEAGSYTRNAATTGTVSIPGSCLEMLPIKDCALAEMGLKGAPPNGLGFDAAKCGADGTGGCTCSVAKKEAKTGTYTVENGSTIRTDDDRTYDFCVNPAETLTFRDSAAQTGLAATLVLKKKP